MKKFKKLTSLLLSLSLVLLTACSGAANSSAPASEAPSSEAPASSETPVSSEAPKVNATIRLGRVGNGLGGIDAAILDGAFKEAGITVEKQTFSSGTDAIAALIGGSLDLFLGSYEHVLRQISNGLDVKAFALISNTQGYQLMVRSDATFQKLEDLKGQTIGVTKVGSLSDTTLRKVLKEVNVDPEKDVKIINGGTGATIVAALETKNVAAAMVSDPTRSQLLEEGKYRVLYDPDFETAGLVLMGSTKWAGENADALKALLKVIQDETKKIDADPESFVSVFKPEFSTLSDSVLLEAIKNNISRSPADLIVTKAAADDVLKTQLELGNIKKEIPLEEGYDPSYLPK